MRYQRKAGSRVTRAPSRVRNQAEENKHFAKHNNFTPGLFTVLCEHGCFYGAAALTAGEGAYDGFAIMHERMIDGPPPRAVYDNGCVLAQYALSRRPEWFWWTRFNIDALHYANHVQCSSAFNIDLDLSGVARSLNTQAAEQRNSVLDRILKQYRFMTPVNATRYLEVFMADNNARVNANSQARLHAEAAVLLKGA